MIVSVKNKFPITTTSPIIVALDYHDLTKTLSFIDNINHQDCQLKVGMQMFTLYGPKFIQTLHQRGFQVFLDLKFHDIPNTVMKAVRAAAEIGVWMVNVHASGGAKMMIAAKEALIEYGKDAPILIAVTVLTSMKQSDLNKIGIQKQISDQVLQLSKLAKKCNLDGVVCSAHDVLTIKSVCGNDFLSITPGIRPNNTKINDQSRIMTPEQAINSSIDYMIIGRPITCSSNPALSLAKINHSIGWIK
ncbi:MAG: orotidine-5'-phosphate decarboxylase [Arsenophonus sp. ET-YP4-MAG3]